MGNELQRLRKSGVRECFLGVPFLLVAGLLLTACAQEYPTIARIKRATIPLGDTVGLLSDPIREDHALRFRWTVDTHLEGPPYLEWVTATLKREGFTVHERREHSVTLTKLAEGDAYRVTFEVAGGHPTRVQVEMTVSPG